MIKSLLIVTVLCIAACLAADETNVVVEPSEKINTVICQERVKPTDMTTQVTRMQDCLRQKRFENMLKSRQKRSQAEWGNQLDLITKKFDIENLLNSIRAIKQQQPKQEQATELGKKSTGKNRLNMIVAQLEEVDTTTTGDEQDKPVSTLSCEDRVIRIESATLTDKDYENKCLLVAFNATANGTTADAIQKRIADALVELNDTCMESERTTELTAKLCDGKSECEIDLSVHYPKICDCTQKKYIDVTYTCEEQPKQQRSKRALNYRNSDYEMAKESAYRQRMARAEGLDQFLEAYGDIYYNYDNAGASDYYPAYYYDYAPAPRGGKKGGRRNF